MTQTQLKVQFNQTGANKPYTLQRFVSICYNSTRDVKIVWQKRETSCNYVTVFMS